jgi:hypothetical protein
LHVPVAAFDRRQTVLLAAMIAILVARPLVPEDPGGQNGYGAPFTVLWLVLAGAWLLGQLRRGEHQLRLGWPDALVLALVGWHTVSALVAFHVGSPRSAINILWEWVGFGTTFFLARQLILTVREARAVIVVMIGLSCGLSAMAVHQYFVTIPNDVRSYEAAKDSADTLYQQTGQWLPPGSSARQQFESRLNSRLPGATFALSNSLAGFLVPWFVILFAITIGARRAVTLMAGIACMALMSVCIYLTGSRSGGLAVVAGIILAAANPAQANSSLQTIRRAAIAALVAMLIAAPVVGFGTTAGRAALAAAERSLAFRFEYWTATLAIIRDYPLFGCGPGQFQDYYATYKLPQASEIVQDPHNWLIEVWATAGTPAALLLLGVLSAVFVRTWRAGSGAATDNEVPITSAPGAAVFGGAAGVALGTAIAWLSGFPLARTHMVLVVAGIVGAWWIERGWLLDGQLSRRLPLVAVIALLVNLLAAGGIGYSGVAGSLWLLMAVELNLSDRRAAGPAGEADENWRAPRWLQSKAGRWGACLGLTAMLAAAIWTEYLPVMACRLQLSIADTALASGRVDQSRAALEAAAAADSWSPEAASQLADQRFADYQTLPTQTQQRGLLEADAAARRLTPHRSIVWAQSAEFAAAIHQHTDREEDLSAAQGYVERAIELFPSRAELHAQAANLWQSAGKEDRAREAAAEAIRLDDLMRAGGHTDRLLEPAIRKEMETIKGKPSDASG